MLINAFRFRPERHCWVNFELIYQPRFRSCFGGQCRLLLDSVGGPSWRHNTTKTLVPPSPTFEITLWKGIPCQIDAESFPYAPRALFDMESYVKPFGMEPMSIVTWSSMSKLYVRGGINLTWYPMSKLIYTKTRWNAAFDMERAIMGLTWNSMSNQASGSDWYGIPCQTCCYKHRLAWDSM